MQQSLSLYVYIYIYTYIHTYTYQTDPDIDQTAYMDARKKYHKITCTSIPEDEHLDVRNTSKITYEGESKSKGKIHLTALIEVIVSNFTYYFST